MMGSMCVISMTMCDFYVLKGIMTFSLLFLGLLDLEDANHHVMRTLKQP